MASRSNKRRDLRTPLSCPVYYSDGEFHASGMTENLTNRGGCLRGTHLVSVGMKLVLLLIPTARRALIIKKATVRWTDEAHFGVELGMGRGNEGVGECAYVEVVGLADVVAALVGVEAGVEEAEGRAVA